MREKLNRGEKSEFPRLETLQIDAVLPAEYNPRLITESRKKALRRSLESFGNLSPITVNARTGNIVGGHQRIKILREIGETEVQVWLVDLSPDKERAANLALNNQAGDWDNEKLKAILGEIESAGLLDLTGFDVGDLRKFSSISGSEERTESEDVPEKFEVVVACASEEEQREVFEKLHAEGRTCRLLTF